jgi:hypothetical protein
LRGMGGLRHKDQPGKAQRKRKECFVHLKPPWFFGLLDQAAPPE